MMLVGPKPEQAQMIPTHGQRIPRKPPATVCKALQTRRSILFMVDQLTELGGGERALFDLARELRRFGFRVSVVAFRGKPDPAAYTLFDNITLMPFSSCFSLGALQVAAELRSFIRREQIGIVQTYFESSDTFGALVARLSGVRCIISSRRDMGILRTAKHHFAYRLLGKRYSAVLAVSEQARIWHIKADRLPAERTHTIHNGLAIERFLPLCDRDEVRRSLGLPAGVPLVTTLSNINPWKGVDVFLRSAAVVHRTHPTAIFAVGGDWTDRPLLTSLRQQAHSLGIEGCTYFLGHVAEVPSLLLSSDIFALLSRSEGLPNVVLEAMAAALPVVATAVGGTPEAVVHGVTGFLVENEDADTAATHIAKLLSNNALRRHIGLAGQERVRRHFSLRQMVRKHINLYDSLSKTAY